MVFESIRRRFEKPRPEDTGYEGKQVARAGAPQGDEYEVPETLRPHTTSRREKEEPRYRDEPAGTFERAKWRTRQAREKVGKVQAKVEQIRGEREIEQIVRKTKKLKKLEEKSHARATKAGIAEDIISQRRELSHQKRTEFRAKHPYVSEAMARGKVATRQAKQFGAKVYQESAKEYQRASGLTYQSGQRIAQYQARKEPKIKVGKTVRMTEMTPTRQDMLAPTPPAYMLMGTISGLGQMLQTGAVQKQAQILQTDYLAGIGTGLGRQVDYFGTKQKNGKVQNGTGLGLGLGLGIGKQVDYFGGSKLTDQVRNGKKKSVRYY